MVSFLTLISGVMAANPLQPIVDLMAGFSKFTGDSLTGFLFLAIVVATYMIPAKLLEKSKLGVPAGLLVAASITYYIFNDQAKAKDMLSKIMGFTLYLALTGVMTYFAYDGYKKNKDSIWSKFFISFSALTLSSLFVSAFAENGAFYGLMKIVGESAFALVALVINVILIGSAIATVVNGGKLIGSFFHKDKTGKKAILGKIEDLESKLKKSIKAGSEVLNQLNQTIKSESENTEEVSKRLLMRLLEYINGIQSFQNNISSLRVDTTDPHFLLLKKNVQDNISKVATLKNSCADLINNTGNIKTEFVNLHKEWVEIINMVEVEVKELDSLESDEEARIEEETQNIINATVQEDGDSTAENKREFDLSIKQVDNLIKNKTSVKNNKGSVITILNNLYEGNILNPEHKQKLVIVIDLVQDIGTSGSNDDEIYNNILNNWNSFKSSL